MEVLRATDAWGSIIKIATNREASEDQSPLVLRVSLSRGKQKAIIQGMVHIAPQSFYKIIQRGVDWAARANYQIFHEGIDGKPQKDSSRAERWIQEFFLVIFSFQRISAVMCSEPFEDEAVSYPAGAINADISIALLAREVFRSGFRCGILLRTFTKILEVIKRKGVAWKPNQFLGNRIRRGINWFLKREDISPVIMDFRNNHLIKTVLFHSDGRNILIHYGNAHVKGIVELLKQDGWEVTKTTHLNLYDFS